jgi:Transposase DDE domain
MRNTGRIGGRLQEVRRFIEGVYGGELHAKRIESLAGATLGVMASASLAVALIGQALATARGLVTKHAIKQIDRLLSNEGVDVWDSFARWVPHVVGERRDILVAMDWTDFDRDGQATLALSLVTAGHGRAMPLLWLTAWKEELAGGRNAFEDACLERLRQVLPAGCRATILADRGFGDTKLFGFLEQLGFGYVIRFRGNIHVTDASGETRPAADWVGKGGRARKLRDARVAVHGRQVGAVVCVHAKGMKEPWCLAASDAEAPTATLVNHYAKRWTIEPSFRDTKDLRFGMGLAATRIGEPTRRDRLLLVNAFAMALLTMLGAAGEALGLDRMLKSNTSKRRTHSLFRQGCMLYELIPMMPEPRLAPLLARFGEMLAQCAGFGGLFAAA